jgi:hypothetical protein
VSLPKPRSPFYRFWGRPAIWMRRARVAVAQWHGAAEAWLWRDGRARVLSLAVPVAVMFIFNVALWQVALGYVAAVVILWALFRAHMRVVIEGFDDYTTPPGQPTDTSGPHGDRDDKAQSSKDMGLAVLLANKLAGLRELYGFVDDPDKTPAPGRAVGATVQLADASDVLRSAVTTESTVSLGPITLPWGALMGAVARLSQAPQLRGAIHGDDRTLILTSSLTRHREPYSWHVAGDVEPGSSPRKRLESMVVDELAFQVFSDLTLQRQARWPATKYWLVALGKMADCQRRPRNRLLLLKEAERNFVKALSEDEHFYLACLNLGIVYRRLALELEREPERRTKSEAEAATRGAKRYRRAARRVFERAIDLRPDRWEAYHALADVHWTPNDPSGSLEMIPGLCERALDRDPDRAARARILDLKAHAEEKTARIARDEGRRKEADALQRTAVVTRKRACRCALRALRKARTRQNDPNESRRLGTLEKQTSQCLVNLASTAWTARATARLKVRRGAARDRVVFRRVHATVKFAAKLSDLDADGHASLAQMASEAKKSKIAADEFAAAARIAPASPDYAAKLALTLAPKGDRRALDACERAERLIDFGARDEDAEPGTSPAEILHMAYVEVAKHIDEAAKRATDVEGRLTLPHVLQEAEKADGRVDALTTLLAEWPPKRDWEKARIQEALGTAISESDDEKLGSAEQRGKNADAHLKAALNWFVAKHPGHRRITELHAERAQALSLVPACSGEALAQAETAVTLDPLCARYRDILASAYEIGRDLDSAVRAADYAVLLEPDAPHRHHRKAKLKWALAESLADPAAHDAQRRAASKEFEHALTLYESDETGERRATSWWLARSYFAMSDFNLVPPHLRFVLGSLTQEDEDATEGEQLIRAAAEMWLSMTYRKLQNFHAAETHARKAIDAAETIDATMAVRDEADERLKLIFPKEMEDADWPLGLVLALAHVQLASSRAERGADLAQAWASLEAAKAVLERMKRIDGLSRARREAESDYEAARGRVFLARAEPDQAIAAFDKAADLDPGEADVYLLLARAHARATEQQVEREWQAHLRAARDACRRTREIGGERHPDALAAAELERELRRIETDALGYRDFTAPVERRTESPSPAAPDERTETPSLIDIWSGRRREQRRRRTAGERRLPGQGRTRSAAPASDPPQTRPSARPQGTEQVGLFHRLIEAVRRVRGGSS